MTTSAGRPRLSTRKRPGATARDEILDAAAELFTTRGFTATSTRTVADAVGIRQASMYHHFATKDDILDAVANEIVASVDTTMFGTLDWADALRAWAYSYRAALAAHPNIVPYLARGPGRRPASLAIADAVYGALVKAGWPPARATHVGALMRYFVAGSALGSFARGYVEDPELYAAHYPHLSQAHRLAGHQRSVDDGAFELGLDALLLGLARVYEELGTEASTR